VTDDLLHRRRWLLGMLAVASSPVLSAEASDSVADASELSTGAVVEIGARRAPSVRSQIGRPMALVAGKSTLIHVDSPIERISVGNPAVADVTLISPQELYLLGKTFGSTNLIVWRKGGPTTIIDLSVSLDTAALRDRLRLLLPGESAIAVYSAADSVVLSGVVSSAMRAEQASAIADAFVRSVGRGVVMPVAAGDGRAATGQPMQVSWAQASPLSQGAADTLRPRVVNLLQVMQPQQVMLEVKVAEVSKSLLDQLGARVDGVKANGDWRYSILSQFLSGSNGLLGIRTPGGDEIRFDAERRDGLIKILAEPNIVAVSGHEASFLAGGKIFIPVARANAATGANTVTLEEKEFGIGLKFTPTVLDSGRIHLRVAPEVSELSQTGSPFVSVGGATSILPSFTMRRAQTSVQLSDGQSLAIAGLIRSNVNESIKRLPWLGDLPVIGALFRSAEFQADQSELMFVVTPRLVAAVSAPLSLPTDSFTPPNRIEFFGEGRLEGSGHPSVTEAPRQGGFNAAPDRPDRSR
jgi:pilus assembly protein CpaC